MELLTLVGVVGFVKKSDVKTGTCLNISVASNKRTKDKFDEFHQETTWYNVALYDKRAEYFQNSLKKGQHVFVMGELSVRTHKGKDGLDKTSLNVVNVKHIELLAKPNDNKSTEPQSDNIPF